MIENSARYGLYNPAFTEDIGQNMLKNISGNKIKDLDDYRISGTTSSMDDVNFNNGLTGDKFESSTKKDKVKKGILIGLAALAVLLVGKKFGGKIKTLLKKIPGVSKVGTKIKAAFNSLKSKIKLPSLKGLGTKIKTFFTNIKSKIKLPSLKGIGAKIKGVFKK